MKQLLNQAERAEPAADGTAEDDPEERKDAKHIPPCLMAGRRQRILDGTQRACSYGAGAGITVETRHTGKFRLADIDFPVNEAPEMGVIEQRAV